MRAPPPPRPSLGLGLSLGVLLGLVSIPVPGLGRFSLGLAGGPLIVALILERLGRLGGIRAVSA